MALAKGARQKGVKIIEGVSVTGVTTHNGRATGVATTQGNIKAEFVVNCAGMWARQLGALNGVCIPNQSTEHYYLITEPIEGMTRELPIIEDPSCHGYYREEGGGLMIGLFEPVCAPWKVNGVPDDFSFGEIEPDWDRMTPFLEKAMSRIPVSQEAGLKMLFCGPESFTPDMGVAFGEAPEIQNYFVAAGLNSIGLITGGGLGKIMAQWITTGDHQPRSLPPLSVQSRIPQNTRGRNAGTGLPAPLPHPRAADRARLQALALPRSVAGPACLLHRRERPIGKRSTGPAARASSPWT